MQRLRCEKGFTLIELTVLCLIGAILAVICYYVLFSDDETDDVGVDPTTLCREQNPEADAVVAAPDPAGKAPWVCATYKVASIPDIQSYCARVSGPDAEIVTKDTGVHCRS